MSIGCVTVFLIDQAASDGLSDAVVARWAQDSDKIEAARRSRPVGAKRTRLGRAMVRALIADTLPIKMRNCDIITNQNGKPAIRLPTGENGPAISISHSGDMVVAAMTSLGQLGVDIETHRDSRPFEELAAFAFGEQERLSAAASPQAFYRIWTLREAISKATGAGLVDVVDGADRVPTGPMSGAWKIENEPATWFLAHIEPRPGYSLAIAIKPQDAFRETIWSLDSIEWRRPASD